ncbi:MAG: Shikimate kinase [Micrococcaceae bacterium]|nr:Shikimate kinase [Micrococcaceae bacterium]
MPSGHLARRHASTPEGGPIVLIGPMAVGKTVIGAELAKALGRRFVDTDQVVIHRHGRIADIFAGRGERHFRELEARAVVEALDAARTEPTVISLGGGAVLDSGTQQLLAGATVVYLEADLETVRSRIGRESGRPLLAGDALERWTQLAATRTPVYRRLADLTLDVRSGGVEEHVRQLVALLQGREQATTPTESQPRIKNGHP